MKFQRISLVFLLLTVHPVFSGHLFLLTSYRSLALTLLSVLAPSVQLHQQFGIPFLTLSVHPIHLTPSGATSKHTISKLLLTLAANPSAYHSLVITVIALYKCIYLLTYLLMLTQWYIKWVNLPKGSKLKSVKINNNIKRCELSHEQYHHAFQTKALQNNC